MSIQLLNDYELVQLYIGGNEESLTLFYCNDTKEKSFLRLLWL